MIPVDLMQLSMLQELDLRNNQLFGTIQHCFLSFNVQSIYLFLLFKTLLVFRASMERDRPTYIASSARLEG